MNYLQIFNPLTFPLKGTILIEASAGTGKTYTLVMIYLRLLLGISDDKSYPRPLSVKEILVVTFTDAATKELRNRIIESIRKLKLACLGSNTEDKLAADLLTKISDTKVAVKKLLFAERQMDDAAIFTIHSFCKRMLNRNAVESGILFQQTLLEDETLLRKKVMEDFWMRHCYPLPIEVARMVNQYWNGPEQLLSDILPYLQGELPEICNINDKNETIIVRHERIIACIKKIKKKWQDDSNDIFECIVRASCSLDQKVYNRKNLLSWLETINKWANTQTVDYVVPKELEKLRSTVIAENSIYKQPPSNIFFHELEYFYKNKLSLRELIFMIALEEISLALEHEKILRSEIGYDDLLRYFDRALVSNVGETLAQSIRTSYPVAMIDEFQDTDPRQYRIFKMLYCEQQYCTMLLIGDPKQAIYAFRGADIFTYMRARKEVNVHYTLDTNWRSSPGMINAVNKLFKCLPAPFIFNEIKFFPVAAATSNSSLRLVVQRNTQPAMRVWFQSSIVGIRDYRKIMARKCAATISNLLNAASAGEAWLEKLQHKKILQASDIVVLVRNGNEAALIHETLAAISIPSVIYTNRDNVFKTHEARELLWILQAVLTPEHDNYLRCAIATSLLGFDYSVIEDFNTDNKRWKQLVEDFSNYRKIWMQHGVLPMLRHIMLRYHIAENLLVSSYGERRLTDVLHLGELLQNEYAKIENKYALVRWLALRIEEDLNTNTANYNRRIEIDKNLVKIVTVHKSKGIEFPIVFLPFAAYFRQQKRALFHDRQLYKVYLDLTAAPDSIKLADEERLAEDLRLLYVAVTRAIYHCSIGLAPIVRGNNKKHSATNSDLHLSALGYLIQQSKVCDAVLLRSKLDKLVVRASGDIEICDNNNQEYSPTLSLVPKKKLMQYKKNIEARIWQVPAWNDLKVTNYTGLQRNNTSIVMDFKHNLDIEGAAVENYMHDMLPFTPPNFPIGSSSGTFLHSLFEEIDFIKPLNSKLLSLQLTKHGIEHFWLPIMQHWIEDVISTQLDNDLLSLRCIDDKSRQVALQFYLSIDVNVDASKIDMICHHYDPLSARCPPIHFSMLKGMFKGIIDLVFIWQDRYYLLDYKSNWLGAHSDDYTFAAIENTMAAKRYDLQYQLYTLALHRYLRHRLVNYDYKRDFGRVFYIFLRGINAPGNGIYHCRPKEEFINELDRLLTKY